MKSCFTFVIVITIILLLMPYGYSKKKMIFRFSGGKGWNIGSHYKGQGSDGTDFVNIQIMKKSNRFIGYGLDLSYLKTLSPVINGIGNKNQYYGTGFVFEISPTNNEAIVPIFQIGINFYTPHQDINPLEVGFFTNLGMAISLNDTVEIPITGRFDFINGRNIPFNGTIGLSFKLD